MAMTGVLVHIKDKLRVLDLESGGDFESLCQWATFFNNDKLVSVKPFVFFNGVSIRDWEKKQRGQNNQTPIVQCGQSRETAIVL